MLGFVIFVDARTRAVRPNTPESGSPERVAPPHRLVDLIRSREELSEKIDGSGAAIGGLAARLTAAYASLSKGLCTPDDERAGLAHFISIRPDLLRADPRMVDPEGLFAQVFERADGAPEEADENPVAGFFEEELAIAVLAVASIDPDLQVARLLELPHNPACLRFCLGIAGVRLAGTEAFSDAERRWFRWGQFCLVHAESRSTSSLLGPLRSNSDPWISTVEFRDVSEPLVSESGRHSAGSNVDQSPQTVHAYGRAAGVRKHKQTVFLDVVTPEGREQFALPREMWPRDSGIQVGDHLSVTGRRGTSRRGEPTIFVTGIDSHKRASLPPSPSPPPRLRAHAEVMGVLRATFAQLGFHEQVTPTLTRDYEGGLARPYTAWVNQRRRLAYLRVTSELNLIRTVAYGIDRCYEIGSSFRNESHSGILTGHDEFLLAEAYAADMDFDEMTKLTVELAGRCAFGATWRGSATTMSFDEAVRSVAGTDAADELGIRRILSENVSTHAAERPFDHALQILLDEIVAPAFDGVFVLTRPPMPSSPLTAGKGADAARRWVYVDGVDCAEVAVNEIDPAVLRERLREQHHRDPACVPRDYTSLLSALATVENPITGTGISVTRLIDLGCSENQNSHVL